MKTAKQEKACAPSLFAATLAGATPVLRRDVPAVARRLHLLKDEPTKPASKAPSPAATGTPREFTASDRALIRKLHGYMSAAQLLGILNERLAADLGEATAAYTLDQLRSEIAALSRQEPAGADWASLRRLLAVARRDGVLGQVDEQVIDDFAVVFSLNPKQVLALKDILLAKEED